MTKITVDIVRKLIADNPKVDQEIDLYEPGKAIVCTAHGWMFYDGSGTYGFNLDFFSSRRRHTRCHVKYILSTIEANPDEQ